MPLHLPNGREILLKRPVIMGILNTTPDSFSDGGQHLDVEAALARAVQMTEQGADVIDVGGESTRPGSQPVPPEQQIERVVPVIERVVEQIPGVLVSIDTTYANVAAAALKAGAMILNDISAGRNDRNMVELAASSTAPIVLMHMQGTPATMQDDPHYDNVVQDVLAFLTERAEIAMEAGVRRDQIIIDPGIGFGKTQIHTLQLLAYLDRFVATGFPVLLGTSRKGFISAIHRESLGQPIGPSQRVGGTCATTALGVQAGVGIFRVHDVLENRQTADVAYQIALAPEGAHLS